MSNKILLFMVLALLLVGPAFFGCGGSNGDQTKPNPSVENPVPSSNQIAADPVASNEKHSPATIVIYNSTTTSKLALKVKDWLKKKGLSDVKADNWTGESVQKTFIFYEGETLGDAQKIAEILSITDLHPRESKEPAVAIGIVLGADFDDINLFANPTLPSGDMSVLDEHSASTEETAAPKDETNPNGIYISLSKRVLSYYEKGFIKGSWKCAVGAPDAPTPTGSYKVTSKAVKPDWSWQGKSIPPGPKNGLGARFLGINKPSYGMHGTNDPESIGRAVSHGCVRMNNRDIITLYDMVKVGTLVTILE